jgi:hypothetical protein
MEIKQIERIQIAASDIKNFNDCYSDCEIHGDREGEVSASKILSWLINNPHMADIAMQIAKNHG